MTGHWGLPGALLALLAGTASGQITEVRNGNTKLDAAQFRHGEITVVDRFPVGSISGSAGRIEVEAIVARNALSASGKTKGVTLRVTNQKTQEETRVASMDLDEVLEASKALAKIGELAADAMIKDRSEVSFRTTSDIVMGYTKLPRQSYGFVSIGVGTSVMVPGLTQYLTSTFDPNELGTLRMLFDRASDLLSAK